MVLLQTLDKITELCIHFDIISSRGGWCYSCCMDGSLVSPMSVTDSATVKWAIYKTDGTFTSLKGLFFLWSIILAAPRQCIVSLSVALALSVSCATFATASSTLQVLRITSWLSQNSLSDGGLLTKMKRRHKMVIIALH